MCRTYSRGIGDKGEIGAGNRHVREAIGAISVEQGKVGDFKSNQHWVKC